MSNFQLKRQDIAAMYDFSKSTLYNLHGIVSDKQVDVIIGINSDGSIQFCTREYGEKENHYMTLFENGDESYGFREKYTKSGGDEIG